MLTHVWRCYQRPVVVPVDQSRKRAREGEDLAAAMRRQQQELDEVVDALLAGRGAFGEDEPWQRPPGVFELPWHKYSNGLGELTSPGWELRDVLFRSLVDGLSAAIGIPGDRLFPPPSKRTMFDELEDWLATAGDDEVDPFWRSVLEAPSRKPTA
jgi:hypothetical protein